MRRDYKLRLKDSSNLFISVAIVVITIVIPSVAHSSSDSFTLAVMRTDGILIPIARHAEGRFDSFWPEYEESSRMKIMSFDELPSEWLENRLPPSKEWLYMDFKGNKKPISLSDKVNDMRCDDAWGIDTDIEKKPYECQNCCPYPKIGIASNIDLDIAPVTKTDMTAPFWEHFKRLYGANVVARLDRALKKKDKLSDTSETSIVERMLIEPNEISIYKVSKRIPIYFYEMILAHDLDNYVAGCPAFDVRQGWIWANDSGKLISISTKTTPTDCDFQQPDLMTPRVYFTFNENNYVIIEERGYESETWVVYEIKTGGIKVVTSAMIHAL